MKLGNRLQSAAAPTLRERAAALRNRIARSTRPADETPEAPGSTSEGEPMSFPTSASADLAKLDALALVSAMKAEWAAQVEYDTSYNDPSRDNEFQAQFERRHSLIDAAEALPATCANLIPKALALAWIEFAELWEHGFRREQYGTDGRLALDIDAIMRRGGTASTDAPPTPTQARSRSIDLVGRIDLAAASVDELRAIRDIVVHVGDAAYVHLWGVRCQREGNCRGADRLNDLGELMMDLGDALTAVESAVYAEAKRRTSGEDDREARLALLASATIENGDPDETQALALELLAHAAAERRGH